MTSKNIKILHIINGEHYSGAERVQDLLAERLSDHGFAVYFVCIKPMIFKMNCKSRSDRIFDFPMKSKFDLNQVLKITRFIKKNNFALIHTHTPRTALIGRLSSILSNVPMVHHVHSPTSNDSFHHLKNGLNDMVERICLTGIKQIVCVSDSLKQYMVKKGFNNNRIRVVHNGVPTPSALDPKNGKQKRNTPFTIGMVALFRPRKGLDVLLNAIGNLVNQGQLDIRLNAVGIFETSGYEEKIKTLSQKLNIEDRINWLGFKHDVSAEFNHLDLFVLPSLFGEGTPMVILEAMAAGIPVLSTKIEGIPEVIKHGVDGFLVDPGNINQLGKAIEAMVLQHIDISKYRKKAYDKQSRFYSDISMAKGVAQIYSHILSLS